MFAGREARRACFLSKRLCVGASSASARGEHFCSPVGVTQRWCGVTLAEVLFETTRGRGVGPGASAVADRWLNTGSLRRATRSGLCLEEPPSRSAPKSFARSRVISGQVPREDSGRVSYWSMSTASYELYCDDKGFVGWWRSKMGGLTAAIGERWEADCFVRGAAGACAGAIWVRRLVRNDQSRRTRSARRLPSCALATWSLAALVQRRAWVGSCSVRRS